MVLLLCFDKISLKSIRSTGSAVLNRNAWKVILFVEFVIQKFADCTKPIPKQIWNHTAWDIPGAKFAALLTRAVRRPFFRTMQQVQVPHQRLSETQVPAVGRTSLC